MPNDSTPATKADIQALMDSIGRLYDATERWKDDIVNSNERWKEEIVLNFGVSVEHIRQDLIGIHTDKIRLLQDRVRSHEGSIRRLENRVQE